MKNNCNNYDYSILNEGNIHQKNINKLIKFLLT
jgi:hypothetical protein